MEHDDASLLAEALDEWNAIPSWLRWPRVAAEMERLMAEREQPAEPSCTVVSLDDYRSSHGR